MTTVRRRGTTVVCAVALLTVAFPIEPVVAVEEAPATRIASLGDLEAGDEQARDEAAEDAVDDLDGWELSAAAEAPIPFTMLGVSAPVGAEVRVRTASATDEWSDWHLLTPLTVAGGPDPGSAEERDGQAALGAARWASEPLWVSDARFVQVQVKGALLDLVEVDVIDSMGLSETLYERAARRLRAQVRPASAEAFPGIKTRKDWGADESIRKGSPSYATPTFAVLHATGAVAHNEYSRSEAPGIIRGIYSYHVKSLGWSDIGYNFLVDRYGTVYEGRYGGIDRGVVGAHAIGFNTGSFGVSLLGSFEEVKPTRAAVDAAIELIAWKYAVHDIDPNPVRMVNVNGQWINTLSAHRDVGRTADPGRYLYHQMDDIRHAVLVASAQYGTPPTPVVGDWNGDGRTTVGWFRNAEWLLRNSNASGKPDIRVTYGRAGDLPVVGDWNGDGRDTIGVVRNGRWLLKNSNRGGSADIDFYYGRARDYPLPGDWNGDGRDGPGIVRDGEWHLRNSLSGGPGQIVFTYGRVTRGDIPLVGDWDGNGRDTPAILRDGEWHLRNSLSGGPGQIVFTYGRVTRGDIPVIGDWNRNGRSGIGVTRGGTWHLRNRLSGGSADLSFEYRFQ